MTDFYSAEYFALKAPSLIRNTLSYGFASIAFSLTVCCITLWARTVDNHSFHHSGRPVNIHDCAYCKKIRLSAGTGAKVPWREILGAACSRPFGPQPKAEQRGEQQPIYGETTS